MRPQEQPPQVRDTHAGVDVEDPTAGAALEPDLVEAQRENPQEEPGSQARNSRKNMENMVKICKT